MESKTPNTERERMDNTWRFLLYGSDGTGSYENATVSTLEKVLDRQEQFFESYELTDAACPFEFVISFMNNYDSTEPIKLTEDNLNRPLLSMYLSNWRSRTVFDSPKNRVPCHSIFEPSVEP